MLFAEGPVHVTAPDLHLAAVCAFEPLAAATVAVVLAAVAAWREWK